QQMNMKFQRCETSIRRRLSNRQQRPNLVEQIVSHPQSKPVACAMKERDRLARVLSSETGKRRNRKAGDLAINRRLMRATEDCSCRFLGFASRAYFQIKGRSPRIENEREASIAATSMVPSADKNVVAPSGLAKLPRRLEELEQLPRSFLLVWLDCDS